MPELEPEIADDAPSSETFTAYDEAHLVTYVRLLDAEAEGAHWREAARIVLRRDSGSDADGARHCWESHLARAKWLVERGYRQLLIGARG